MKIAFNLSFFILLAFSASALQCSSKQYVSEENKTFFMPRSPANLALEYTAGWSSLIYRDTIDKFGGNVQAIYFSENSLSKNRLGSYFSPARKGCNNDHCFSFGMRRGPNQTLTENLNVRDFIHIPTFPTGSSPSSDERAATMKLSLQRKLSGVAINIHQDLDTILKGLFFKVNIPITSTDHKIDCTIHGYDLNAGADTPTIANDQIQQAIAHYFSGNAVNITFADETTTGVLQKPLVKLIIPSAALANPCRSNKPLRDEREIGLADVDIQLGYHFFNTQEHRLAAGITVTIPTGNEPKAARLWEPILGDGGHSAIGLSLYADTRLWGSKNHNLFIMGALNYHYLFAADEHRTLGLYGQPWGHYRLLGKQDQQLLIPAANILAKKVSITPGNHVDCIVQGIYNFYGFAFDLGCNLYYKAEESLHFGETCIIEKNTYAFPSPDFDNSQPGVIFGENNSDFEAGIKKYLSEDDIDKAPAKTPSQLSFKVYSGISYCYKTWSIPLMVGIGGHYEMGATHKAPDTWGFTFKAAVAF